MSTADSFIIPTHSAIGFKVPQQCWPFSKGERYFLICMWAWFTGPLLIQSKNQMTLPHHTKTTLVVPLPLAERRALVTHKLRVILRGSINTTVQWRMKNPLFSTKVSSVSVYISLSHFQTTHFPAKRETRFTCLLSTKIEHPNPKVALGLHHSTQWQLAKTKL